MSSLKVMWTILHLGRVLSETPGQTRHNEVNNFLLRILAHIDSF